MIKSKGDEAGRNNNYCSVDLNDNNICSQSESSLKLQEKEKSTKKQAASGSKTKQATEKADTIDYNEIFKLNIEAVRKIEKSNKNEFDEDMQTYSDVSSDKDGEIDNE